MAICASLLQLKVFTTLHLAQGEVGQQWWFELNISEVSLNDNLGLKARDWHEEELVQDEVVEDVSIGQDIDISGEFGKTKVNI